MKRQEDKMGDLFSTASFAIQFNPGDFVASNGGQVDWYLRDSKDNPGELAEMRYFRTQSGRTASGKSFPGGNDSNSVQHGGHLRVTTVEILVFATPPPHSKRFPRGEEGAVERGQRKRTLFFPSPPPHHREVS